jgi:hypothetical protein
MSTSILPAIIRNTAADITNFKVGQHLVIDANGQYEQVQITEVFGNAFYAEYQYPHEFGFTIQTNPGGTGGGTTTEPITPGAQTVTVSGLNYVGAGDQVVFEPGTPNEETVILTATDNTAVTLTAVFTLAHDAGVTFIPIPIDTTATTGFTGLAPAPIQSPPQIDLDIYDGGAPIEVDPTLQYPVSVPFTTRQENDFPGVSLEGPVITKEDGQQVNLNGE